MINWRRHGPSTTSSPARFSWPEMSEDLPVDVLPCSNEEYFPPPPSQAQKAIMRIASDEVERVRRRFGMTRAQFVRTAAATAIGFWAIDFVRMGFGSYGFAQTGSPRPDACDLEWAGAKGLETLRNLPGEFIFDVQSHHVDPDGMWRGAEVEVEVEARPQPGRVRGHVAALGTGSSGGGAVIVYGLP